VIVLDWSDAKKNYQSLFEKEDTTKNQTMIHAWGYNKLTEYLKRIKEG